MRPVNIDNIPLHLESAEAGTRYFAPILILPGLFQSVICWRGMTSMLAHRGWDVYVMPRLAPQSHQAAASHESHDWNRMLEATAKAASSLADQVILLGADVGACAALELSDVVKPLALGLFGPNDPSAMGAAFDRSLGFFARRRIRKDVGPIAPPPEIAAKAYQRQDIATEPRPFLEDLVRGVPFRAPAEHPPAIVFHVDNDPLIAERDVDAYASSAFAKAAKTRLNGRFWPSLGWEGAAADVHRFLILTLSDRVVDFPDEILEG